MLLMLKVFSLSPLPTLSDEVGAAQRRQEVWGLQDKNVPIRAQLPVLDGERLEKGRRKAVAREMAG